jgi:excisionase family DNA binding protein
VSDADITLQEAADLLGVHYMTAYRYVRLGLLPADKVGSTWRVRRADLEQFRGASATQATAAAPGHGRRRAPWAERLEARLVAGDSRGAWGVVEAALAAGTEIDTLYLDVIAPAMASIGERWGRGELDIATEHRASGIALRLLGRLGPRFVRRGRTRGAVVLGAPAGERHFLPVSMLADLLRAAGWDVSDLGADLPAASFVQAALDTPRLVAVGVSVTSPDHLDAAVDTVAALRSALPAAVPVLVGGRGVRDAAHAAALGADAFAEDGRGAVALVEAAAAGRLGPAAAGGATG